MGMSNSAICHELEIGVQELGTLTKGILKKLNAGSREQLMRLSKALVEGSSEIS
jgi:DNA-binding CsgD family transcriptional regulator